MPRMSRKAPVVKMYVKNACEKRFPSDDDSLLEGINGRCDGGTALAVDQASGCLKTEHRAHQITGNEADDIFFAK